MQTVIKSTRNEHEFRLACPRNCFAIRNIAIRFTRPTVRSGFLCLSAVERTSTITRVRSSGVIAKISSSSLPKRTFLEIKRQPAFRK